VFLADQLVEALRPITPGHHLVIRPRSILAVLGQDLRQRSLGLRVLWQKMHQLFDLLPVIREVLKFIG
jgi:hypothetical protein